MSDVCVIYSYLEYSAASLYLTIISSLIYLLKFFNHGEETMDRVTSRKISSRCTNVFVFFRSVTAGHTELHENWLHWPLFILICTTMSVIVLHSGTFDLIEAVLLGVDI